MTENLPAVPNEGVQRIPRPPAGGVGLRPIREALANLAAEASSLAKEGDRPLLAYGYVELSALLKDLRIVLDLVGDHIIETSDFRINRAGNRSYEPFLVDETAYFEILRKGARTTWESESLFNRLMQQSLVGPNGEAPDIKEVAGAEKLAATLRLVTPILNSSFGWKKGELRKLGIDPDDYSENNADDPGYSLKVTGAHPEGD